jgi:hypothetical protein
MTNHATKTFRVAVIDRFHAYYKVEAADARAAAIDWGDGELVGQDYEAFDDEGPCGVCERQPDGTWREVPESEWKDEPEIVRFDAYEVHGVREFDDGAGKYCEQVPDDEAEFWSLYGHIPGQGLECIGDFKTRELAEEVNARITGRRYGSPA